MIALLFSPANTRSKSLRTGAGMLKFIVAIVEYFYNATARRKSPSETLCGGSSASS
jgi:hypothetical protein